MRVKINSTVRRRACAIAPWLPWVVPGAFGGADALNIVEPPAENLYLFMLAFAIATSAAWQGSRLVCRNICERMERAAEKAQVGEAATLIYQLASEHLDARQEVAEQRPVAVGEVITDRIPALHVVHCDDVAEAKRKIYQGNVATATAAVPQQSGRPRLATTRHLRPQP